MEPIPLGKRLKIIRATRNLTQNEIAKIIGKTSATVSDIERGEVQLSVSDLEKIAAGLELPIESFFGVDFGNNNIRDLVTLIKRQPKALQEKIIRQVRMLILLNETQKQLPIFYGDLTDQEIADTLGYVMEYFNDIEEIYTKMIDFRKRLRVGFTEEVVSK